MPNQSLAERVEENLTQAVASGLLPASVQGRAEELLAKLNEPIKIGVLGMPKSGKSTLLNFLVGSEVIPRRLSLPTLQLSYGDAPEAVCTLPDGSKSTLATSNMDDIAALSPVFVDLRLPLPALAKISVLEVVAPDDTTAMHRASQWASKRCNVAMWCSPKSFGNTEQVLWAQMPDVLKDHSFLLLTKADYLRANGMYDATLSTVKSIAEHEFHQILPIATNEAIAARQSDGSVDKNLMRNSGGLALISGVLKQVELGRQSTVDMADVLLHQHSEVLDSLAPERDADAPKKVVPPKMPSGDKRVSAEDAATSEETVAQSETLDTESDAAKAENGQALDATEESGGAKLGAATIEAYEKAVGYIVSQSREMIDLADALGKDAPVEIIAKTVDHVQWLSDFLNENGDEADEKLQRARDTVMDAADLVQLMQMEKSDSAAVEALSVLLQIKHELQGDLAA